MYTFQNAIPKTIIFTKTLDVVSPTRRVHAVREITAHDAPTCDEVRIHIRTLCAAVVRQKSCYVNAVKSHWRISAPICATRGWKHDAGRTRVSLSRTVTATIFSTSVCTYTPPRRGRNSSRSRVTVILRYIIKAYAPATGLKPVRTCPPGVMAASM